MALFGLFGKRKKNPGDATRMQLHGLAMENATANPYESGSTQAAFSQLNRLTGQREQADDAQLARMGMGGTEMAIAQGQNRARAYTDSMLGIFQGAEHQRMASLSQAFGSQQMVDQNFAQQEQLRLQRQAQMFQLIGTAAQAAGAAYGGGGK